ncbi:MAG: 3-hydroxyacyl-ACP dehydratase FabZ family protein [Planctomycetota bacterium]
MKFRLIDSIESVSDDKSKLVARKNVSLAEEYLGDHFPSFPVLPGVMMLEALTQASAWLVHLRSDFAHSMVVLKRARNVRYGTFVAPGDTLDVTVELKKEADGIATFDAVGTVAGERALAGKLDLSAFNLADKQAAPVEVDSRLVAHHKAAWATLTATGPLNL